MANAWALALLLVTTGLAGCIGTDPAGEDLEDQSGDAADYVVPEPVDLPLVEEEHFIEMADGERIHARILRPDLDEPVPIVAEYTIYNAAGEPTWLDLDARQQLGVLGPGGSYYSELVRRGFAFAYVDTRGSSGSTGCGDLRGSQDIEDAFHITAYLSNLTWSNGKVAFIGASYPGSMAHIAGIANGPGLAAVIPVVASTSFYHYHHNGGVPYDNVATNPGYTGFNLAPSANPQHPTAAERTADDALCPYAEDIARGATKDGRMDAWWADRNLRPLVGEVEVPVLMAQGLADWNVKPDHIAHYFNDLTAPKKAVFGQFSHQTPPGDDNPFGTWWALVVAFLDQHLRGVETGVMDGPAVWVEDTTGTWRGEDAWPPLETSATPLYLGSGALAWEAPAEATAAFSANPLDALPLVPVEELVYTSEPFEAELAYAGAPTLTLTVEADRAGHLVAVLYNVAPDGTRTRENYGYLNLALRDGVDGEPQELDGPTEVTLTMYPQDDVIEAGHHLELVLRGTDDGGTLPPRFAWTVTVHEGPGAALWLPVRGEAAPEPAQPAE